MTHRTPKLVTAKDLLDHLDFEDEGWTVLIAKPRRTLRQSTQTAIAQLELSLSPSGLSKFAPESGRELAELLSASKPGSAAVVDLGLLPDFELEILDQLRNRILGRRVVVITTLDGAERLARHAPHLWAWVGSHVGLLDNTSVLSDPDLDWCERNTEVLKQHPDSFVAVDRDEGVVLAHSEFADEFAKQVSELKDRQKSPRHLFLTHTTRHVRASA